MSSIAVNFVNVKLLGRRGRRRLGLGRGAQGQLCRGGWVRHDGVGLACGGVRTALELSFVYDGGAEGGKEGSCG